MPTDHQYKNGAGTMMVCDLGAAHVESDRYPWSGGLYYQYGRKDPFWGDRSCTLDGWENVGCNKTTGTESYAAAHPTTFIYNSDGAYGFAHWLHSGETRLWRRTKSISDPCPPGYVIPDGGQYGVWARASGRTSAVSGECSSYVFFNGSGADLEFRSAGECWYRPNGYISYLGYLSNKTTEPRRSYYWSGTSSGSSSDEPRVYCYSISIWKSSQYTANPNGITAQLCEGYSVRCMKKTW